MKVFVSSVMWETWKEREISKLLLREYGYTPILKANYEKGPGTRETIYYTEPTSDLISACDYFLMIPGLNYGLTTASGRSMSHEELIIAQQNRKKGVAFGPYLTSLNDSEKPQQRLIQKLRAYLGEAFKEYETLDQFETTLRNMLSSGLDEFCIPLLPNRLFLSHSSNDKGFVDRLATCLQRNGFDTWYDKVDILAGDGLITKIRKGIEKSAFVILVLSPDSINSTWVHKEISLAIELEKHWGHKVLIPVKCREFDWPSELKDLQDLKYVDFTCGWEDAIRDLVSSLRSID